MLVPIELEVIYSSIISGRSFLAGPFHLFVASVCQLKVNYVHCLLLDARLP